MAESNNHINFHHTSKQLRFRTILRNLSLPWSFIKDRNCPWNGNRRNLRSSTCISNHMVNTNVCTR